MIKNLIALTLTMVVVTTSIQARPFNKTTKTTNSSRPIANAVSHSLSSAQAVANHMSKIGRIRNCCFYGQYSIKDQGVAQGSNGMWYACNRY
jgi:hypothetical protein